MFDGEMGESAFWISCQCVAQGSNSGKFLVIGFLDLLGDLCQFLSRFGKEAAEDMDGSGRISGTNPFARSGDFPPVGATSLPVDR